MNTNGILHPCLFYGLLALGLGCCLYLFYTLKLEIQVGRKRAVVRIEMLEDALQGLRAGMEDLREELQRLQVEPPGMAPYASINLTKRAQVLRLHRRGEAVPTIAGTLGLPQKEVELLLKVHRLMLEQP